MAFRTVTVLYSHRLQCQCQWRSRVKHLTHYKQFHPPALLPSAPGKHQSVFCLSGFIYSECFLQMESYNILFGVWSVYDHLSRSVMPFEIHACCSVCCYFIPFYSWITFYCTYVWYFVYPATHWWIFGLFPLLAVVNVAMNICLHVLVRMFVFNYLGYISQSRNSGSCGNSMFHFLRNC